LAEVARVIAEAPRPNTRLNIEVAKSQTFNGEASKVSGFLIVYKLCIRIRIRDVAVEE